MFSKMDVKAVFFAIATTPEPNDTTDFYVDSGRHLKSKGNSDIGRYKYNRLIMGVQSFSAVLQMAMENILQGILHKMVYCVDIDVHKPTMEKYIDILGQVFSACQKWGIKPVPGKCTLAEMEIDWLGYHLGEGTARLEKDKLEQIAKIKPPTTPKQIRQCLGIFGLFHIFVKSFSHYLGIMMALARKISNAREAKCRITQLPLPNT